MRNRRLGVLLAAALSIFFSASGATFEVSTTNSSGAGSFRQAILNANSNAGPDRIIFNIPGTGVQTIRPGTALPDITDPVDIDGATQPGSSLNTLTHADNAVWRIDLDGVSFPFDGLVLRGGNATVRGLAIRRFLNGISFRSSSNLVAGNYIGTDETGANAAGNTIGVYLTNVCCNTIGGVRPEDRNVIAGNGGNSIKVNELNAPPARDNAILGNFIGVKASGLVPSATPGSSTIAVRSAVNLVVGGLEEGARNIIAGQVTLYPPATNTHVLGNYIGVGSDGITPTQAGLVSGVGSLGPGGSPQNPVPDNFIRVEGNRIAFQITGVGVVNVRTIISRNSIFSNSGQGIFLGSAGLTNDAGDLDIGANGLQNYPDLTAAVFETNTVISGFLGSKPSAPYTIEFFASSAPHSSGFGEGEFYLGSTNVTTSGSGTAPIQAAWPGVRVSHPWITATATDSEGNTSMFSRAVRARSFTFPLMVRQPVSLIVTQGDSAAFSVQGEGALPMSYQWRRNGSDIAGATNESLNFTNVQWALGGNYSVKLSNSFDVTESSLASLLVRVKPVIIQPPLSQRIAIGESVTFSVSVSNSAPFPLTYQWRRNGFPVTTMTRAEHTASYTVTNESGNAAYSVAVSNIYWPSAIISANAFVTLLPDTDHDGLPDEYELAHEFDPEDPDDAGLDSDGDGASNAREYAAGTDPRNPSSRLQVERIEFKEGTVLLELLAPSNKTCSVQFKPALDSTAWLTLTNFAARRTNAVTFAIDQVFPSQRFYRIATPPDP